MNIALIGYGKMGKTIEKIAKNRNHVISRVVDVTNPHMINDLNAEVAIEFTRPDAAVNNIKACIDQSIPVISGTTGWLSEFENVTNYCEEKNGTFFYASNFSLGVNLFFKLNERLAEMMDAMEGYDAEITEIHHTQKLDKPSGTAISLAEGIIKNHKKYGSWINDKKSTSDLTIWSIRESDAPGTHEVKYTSPIDDIEIKHKAKSRDGFALGAVRVAEWIKDKKGVFTMNDYLKI